MEGRWQALDDHGHLASEEHWRFHEGRLLGSGKVFDHGRLRSTEWLEIAQRDGQIVYTAWPAGQDPVGFAMADAGADVVVFQNMGHDFPQVLHYSRVQDQLSVRILGSGQELTLTWELAD